MTLNVLELKLNVLHHIKKQSFKLNGKISTVTSARSWLEGNEDLLG